MSSTPTSEKASTPERSNGRGASGILPQKLWDTLNRRDSSWRVAENLFVSFQYAWEGISYSFNTQRNFRIHVIIGTLAVLVGAVLRLSAVKMAVITLTVGAVVGLELLNTAIESVVDLSVQQSYHELAKVAKDCAAGAVLVSALVSLLVACYLILPPLFAALKPIWVSVMGAMP